MTRKKKTYTAHEKITILKEHLLENLPISKLSKKYGITRSTLYGWKQELFRAGFNTFNKRERKQPSQLDKDPVSKNLIREGVLSAGSSN